MYGCVCMHVCMHVCTCTCSTAWRIRLHEQHSGIDRNCQKEILCLWPLWEMAISFVRNVGKSGRWSVCTCIYMYMYMYM